MAGNCCRAILAFELRIHFIFLLFNKGNVVSNELFSIA